MSISSVKAGEAYIELTSRDSKLMKGLARAQARLKAFSESINAVGLSMVKYSAAMAVPFGLATKRFADFDDQMRLVQGITGITDEELQKLTDTAKKLGRETSYTAAQVAAGMVTLSRMGFTAKETDRAISDFMNLDRATGMNDLAQSAEIASSAMRSFGLSAADSGRIADVLTATANGSSQSLMDLGEALKMAAPNAHMANATLEDTAAMLGVLANMGIKGTMAGTALAKTFQRLASGKGVDLLAGKGIRTKDAAGNMRPMRDILLEIAAVTEKMGSADKIAFLSDVFDVRGVKGGGIISGNIEDLDKMIKKIAESGGVAKKTADKMDSGIGGTFRKLLSAIEGVGLEIGDAIAKFIKPFIDSVSGILNGLAKWIKAHQDVGAAIVKFTAQIAAAGAGLLIFSKTMKLVALGIAVLKIAIAAATVAFTAFWSVLTALAAGPALAAVAFFSIMAAAVVGVIVAAKSLSGTMDTLRAGFADAFSSIRNIVTESMAAIREAVTMGDLAGAVKIALAALRVAWLEGILPVRKEWSEFTLSLADAWTLASGTIRKQASGLWYGLLEGLKTVGNSIADAWSGIWTTILEDFNNVVAELKKKWISMKGIFDSSIDVEAEIQKIDSETKSRNAERWSARNNESDRRTKELEEIRRQGEADQKRIDDETQSGFVKNRREYEASMENAARELKTAREEWKKAMDDVRKKAKENAAKIDVEEKKKQLEAVGNTLQQKIDTKTIAGFDTRTIAEALGGSNDKDQLAERTATATESVARNVDRMTKKLETGTWTLA